MNPSNAKSVFCSKRLGWEIELKWFLLFPSTVNESWGCISKDESAVLWPWDSSSNAKPPSSGNAMTISKLIFPNKSLSHNNSRKGQPKQIFIYSYRSCLHFCKWNLKLFEVNSLRSGNIFMHVGHVPFSFMSLFWEVQRFWPNRPFSLEEFVRSHWANLMKVFSLFCMLWLAMKWRTSHS